MVKKDHLIPFAVITGLGFLVTCVILTIVLIIVSFAKISPNEMGLHYNAGSKHIDRTKLHTSGLHYVGVGNRFIKYPRTMEAVNLGTFASRTSDGLTISLEVSFNYRIRQELKAVLAIYENLGDNYEMIMKKAASDTIRDVSAGLDSFSYFFKRSNVVVLMGDAMTSALSPLGFDIDSFQLLNIAFPTAFSDAISATQVAQQRNITAKFERSSAEVEAKTKINEATETANVMLQEAHANAAAILSAKDAEASGLEASLQKEQEAYSALISTLGYTKQQFLDFIWISTVSSASSQASIVLSKPPSAA